MLPILITPAISVQKAPLVILNCLVTKRIRSRLPCLPDMPVLDPQECPNEVQRSRFVKAILGLQGISSASIKANVVL